MSTIRSRLIQLLHNREFRHWFMGAVIYRRLAWQIRQMRRARGWSVRHVATLARMHYTTVARYEVGLGPMKLQTLKALARVFDVGLIVRFQGWSEFLEDALTDDSGYVASYADDAALMAMRRGEATEPQASKG